MASGRAPISGNTVNRNTNVNNVNVNTGNRNNVNASTAERNTAANQTRGAGNRGVDDEDRKGRRNRQRDDEPGGTAPHGGKDTPGARRT